MEQQYTVSARKFRPDYFSKVVGQQHVTQTLKNALHNNCLAQAFLFCGPRGVGKTTCARILAKAINCEKLTPEGEPCNNCAACQRSMIKESGGVFELDAASNNSVDDIRMLVEQVRYLPQADKYKVYIIDEVHMLSNAAFNAFLKTLEEPPKHAIFILATTEKHKIIPTILSRCQVFDFRRVKTTDIVAHLEYVAKMREIKYEIEALYVLAEKADGALRDALSLLDMVASFEPNGTIHYKNVIENLHIIDYEYYFQIVDSCWEKDIKNCLIQFTSILEKGFDGQNFTSGLCSHIRNLLIIKFDNAPEILLDISDKVKHLYKKQAGKVSIDFLLETLETITKYDFQYKNSYNKRLLIELMLISINTSTQNQNILQSKNSEKKLEPEKKNPTEHLKPHKALYIDKEPEKPLVLEKKDKQEEKITKKEPIVIENSVKQKLNTTIKIPQLNSLEEVKKNQQETIQEPIKSVLEKKKSSNKPLTINNLETILAKQAQNFLKEGRATEHSILTSAKSLENNILTFYLLNPIQKTVLKDLKPAIMAVLKDEFDVALLQIEDHIKMAKETAEKKPYTSNEKLNHLIDKYPLVQDLIKKLSLSPV